VQGLLLTNLGTPDAPTTGAVRSFLREFLSDPNVIDLSAVGRFLLLNLVILPFRPKKSAAAYQKVWDETHGSPLLYNSMNLHSAMQRALGADWQVALGMRYGNPSLKSAMERLHNAGVDELVVLPLYPQYATSSTASSIQAVNRICSELGNPFRLHIIEDFYAEPGFIHALAASAKEHVQTGASHHVLFSCHGLPARQVAATATEPGLCCERENCCEQIGEINRRCYRAQCLATSRLLANELGLSESDWSLSFQSRLGRTPWIQPFTDEHIPKLAASGVRHLHVICHSFTADCLETLEEIGIRARADFEAAGGESLTLVPCMNDHPVWVDTLAGMARSSVQNT
jgi:ferrochelatase